MAPPPDADDSSQNQPINRNEGQFSFEFQPASMTRNHLIKASPGVRDGERSRMNSQSARKAARQFL
ncbi:hypothetical protein IE4771_CH04396 [Rhizobium etli bv. mimosae str. IE4771]|uniref:Uncharacterized protein n=1 Tax=Rhizobium etli bv. mimosae str. IE4771 TaxID=1432050 RepID=A0A060I6C1_RHIET|nr:hypothetical protein IE4771_CH04396 [Rhizobium sp. IE4771]